MTRSLTTQLLRATIALTLFAAEPARALVGQSTFEGDDGNQVVTTPGNLDWFNAPNRQTITDLAPGAGDDSFGQGTKEDDEVPTITDGSIPKNKSDLKHFYFATQQTANGHTFIYLAWDRFNVLGTANMDMEFNAAAPDPAFGNGVTPPRTAGDVLITFDFVNGGGKPVLGLLTWLTSEDATHVCFSAQNAPCWGNRIDLGAAGYAEGNVNTVDIANVVFPNDTPLPALTFGEASVDLTAAGIIPANSCTPFTSAFLKSRSSASFTAAVKDFIRPLHITAVNCGDIKINKTDDSATPVPLPGAVFTLYQAGTTTVVATCTTNSSGVCTMTAIPLGTYDLKETTTPTGYQKAPDQLNITVDATHQHLEFNLVNKRLFRVITLVCQESDDTLWPSIVKFYETANLTGTFTQKTTLDGPLAPSIDENDLCKLTAGASYGDRTAGTYSESIAIP